MRLWRRRRLHEVSILEDEAYARCHGERSGEIVSIARVERKPIPRRTGDLTGELLRRAFEARLDSRGASQH